MNPRSRPLSLPWLALQTVQRAEPRAAQRGVSALTRAPRGFLRAYEGAGGDPQALGAPPGKLQSWVETRHGILVRHLKQAKANGETLWEKRGKYAGWPTRRHLTLILWAFSPDAPGVRSWLARMDREHQHTAATGQPPKSGIPAALAPFGADGRATTKKRRTRVTQILAAVAETPANDLEADPNKHAAARWARIVRDLGYTGSDPGALAFEAGLPDDLLQTVHDRAIESCEGRSLEIPCDVWARLCVYAFLAGGPPAKRNPKIVRLAHRYGWRPGARARYPQRKEGPVNRLLLAAVDVAALDPASDDLLALCEEAAQLAEVESP